MDGKQDQFYSLFFAYSREATINQKKSTETKTASSNKEKKKCWFCFHFSLISYAIQIIWYVVKYTDLKARIEKNQMVTNTQAICLPKWIRSTLVRISAPLVILFLLSRTFLFGCFFGGGKERGCSIIFQFVLCLIVKPLLTWNICFCRLTWILHFICVRFGRQSTALLFLHHRLTKLILMFGHVITI